MIHQPEDLEESVRQRLPFMAKYIVTRVLRQGEDGYFSDFHAFRELHALNLIDSYARIYVDLSSRSFEAPLESGFTLTHPQSQADLEMRCVDDGNYLLIHTPDTDVRVPAQPVLDNYGWRIRWPSLSRGEMQARIDEYLKTGQGIAE